MFFISILLIHRANCEAIPEEICGTGSTPPSNTSKTCPPKPLTLNLNIDLAENKNEALYCPLGKKLTDKDRPKLLIKPPKLNSFNESDSSTKSSAESVDIKQNSEFPLLSHQEEKSRSLTSTPSYLTKKPPLSPPINYGSQTLEKNVSLL